MTLKILSPSYYRRRQFILDNIGKGKKLLNVGCGDGYIDTFLTKRFEHIRGIDINKQDIEIAKRIDNNKNSKYTVSDATRIPFKDNSFDAVICSEIIEHVKDDHKVIDEIYRVLKRGGRLLLTVPHKGYNFSFDPLNYISERVFKKHSHSGIWGFGHLRLYSEDMIRGLLKRFKNVRVDKDLHFFDGIFENCYILNFLQGFVKSDPKNLKGKNIDIEVLIKKIEYDPPRFIKWLRDLIIGIDKKVSFNNKKGFQLLVGCEK